MSRFGNALTLAVVLHGVWLAPWLLRTKEPEGNQQRERAELRIELEPLGSEPSAGFSDEAVSQGGSVRAASVKVAAKSSVGRRPSTDEAEAVVGSSEALAIAKDDSPSLEAPAAGAQEVSSLAPKVNLGLDGSLLRPSFRETQLGQPKPLGLQAKLERDLNGALMSDDVERGHARGNVLLGALSSAARTSGPLWGEAVIQVSVNASGELAEVRLLRGSSDDWATVLQAFRQGAKAKRLRLPPGAQGMRVTFNVSSRVQKPSGNAVDSAPVRLKSPSLEPNGLALNGAFDVTDLSGKSSHAVYARVVREEVL